MSFKEKTVVITGGAKGIGANCSKVFHKKGANICILDIDEEGQNLASELDENSVYVKCDVSKEQDVKNAFEKIVDKYGDFDVSVTETTEQEWDLVLNVNLKSAFLCSKYAIPSMQKKGKGCIINVASVQSYISQKNVAPYTTSKTALLGLTRSIAVDYAPNIRCLAVCPGTVDTPMLRNAINLSPNPEEVLQECHDMHLTKRIGTSDEIAELIAFLASDKAGFITGQSIRIDGGLGISIGGSKRE